MSNNLFLRGVLLLGFALLMFKLIVTGQIQQLIAPKMFPFIYFAMSVLFILGIIQIWRSDHKENAVYCECGHHEKKHPFQSLIVSVLFIVPVITGLMFSSQVLDSSVAAKRGVQIGRQPENNVSSDDGTQYLTELSQNETEKNPIEKSMNKKQLTEALTSTKKVVFTNENYLAILEIIHNNVKRFTGKEIELVGFVYREPDFVKEKAVIARFVVTCCVADASVYGMLASGEQLKQLNNDEWVKVTGIIDKTNYKGNILPCIKIKTVKKVKQPNEPYIHDTAL
ncbi:TIGR03943 family putative permease subunit [Thermaerobacillus caldiproteolyticus]|uniref:TIGR03943 family putative permease subunit n=1 Tax=Thermaerobacillus caldiproteolyticus TaxID=247480 RepID=UPI00188CBFE9|nr:TIGR03943 family protein [Anoxybacillus caldiproteolyticus]QPA30447.1 TIGR03943 family protein [Anoxybacillus caldiproteolyticus]